MKVGVWFDAPSSYDGGVNYFVNLGRALEAHYPSLQLIIFVGSDFPDNKTAQLLKCYQVIKTKFLARNSFVNRVLRKVRLPILLIMFSKVYGIDVFTHIWHPYRHFSCLKTTGWIPDFQYLHLPHLFKGKNVINTLNRRNRKIVEGNDLVFVSSENALLDLTRVSQGMALNASVLKFTTFIDEEILLSIEDSRLNVGAPFFYLPNQFWKHKNHSVVVDAVKILKIRPLNFKVVMSGNKVDFRDGNQIYFDSVMRQLQAEGLSEDILYFDELNYAEVLWLNKNSVAVINPSLFEGWSSTVEEAKALGSALILSDIPVHREQAHSGAKFFQPNDPKELAKILSDYSLREPTTHGKVFQNINTEQFATVFVNALRKISLDENFH